MTMTSAQWAATQVLFSLGVLTFEDWVAAGVAAGFCSEVQCVQHNLLMTEDEIVRFENGEDPCCFAVRVDPDGPA